MKNPLIELREAGQSVWLDELGRDIIRSGELKRLVEEEGLCGVTSNPTIFQKAIEGSDLYDAQVQEKVRKGVRDEKELFLSLTMEDISEAADILFPVYVKSGGTDGFVSIEVSPDLAYDTEATLAEARRLFLGIARKNVLVKVPGTLPGLSAVRQLTSEGINVNITLLFSVPRYEKVMDAYLKGLEERAAVGQPLDGIASVASFFVSRVDTLVDKLLGEKGAPRELYGKAAVANSMLAYHAYRYVFRDERFMRLEDKGARAQRLLWASTSTKDPAYSDIKYVEELALPHTINTMPPDTMMKFKDHGRLGLATPDGWLSEARSVFRKLAAAGIDMAEVTARLEEEGIAKFSESFFDVVGAVARKRDEILRKAA
jgi:transaldolase